LFVENPYFKYTESKAEVGKGMYNERIKDRCYAKPSWDSNENEFLQVVCRWFSGGFQVVFRWFAGGFQVVFRWFSGGFQVVCKWFASGLQVVCR